MARRPLSEVMIADPNLRAALPMWREINPWYESPKIGP